MNLPYFFQEDFSGVAIGQDHFLSEETSKHVVQVLRMQVGEKLIITSGKGDKFTCSIKDDNRKKCTVSIEIISHAEKSVHSIAIAISPVKNTTRFEWFMEKATEMGIDEIVPLICARTEKHHFKIPRLRQIMISAMLQSQQSWLPKLHEPIKAAAFFVQKEFPDKYIAHCEADATKLPFYNKPENIDASVICIGPEGDFTPDEIAAALKEGFNPVSLGNTRLRTETAGIAAAVVLSSKRQL